MSKRLVIAGSLVMVVLASGCSGSRLFSASTWDPLGLRWHLGPHKEPLRIGLCYENEGIFDIRNWGKKAPWDDLRRDLEDHFQRPVEIQNLTPFQIAFHLDDTGELDFALVGAADYLEMTQEGPVGKMLAVSVGLVRQGVIIARAGADISELADLKGRFFAFGPKDDPVLADATLACLEAAGVPPSELKSLLPGRHQHHISSREAAKEVAYLIGTDAGVIEAAEFDAYADTGGHWFPPPVTFSKDQFRVLGRTEPVRVETIGEGPFLAGKHTDAELVEKMREFLLSAAAKHAAGVTSLGFSAFNDVPDDPTEKIKQLAASAAS